MGLIRKCNVFLNKRRGLLISHALVRRLFESGVYLKVGRDNINYRVITFRINSNRINSFYLIILGPWRLFGGGGGLGGAYKLFFSRLRRLIGAVGAKSGAALIRVNTIIGKIIIMKQPAITQPL